ncbi:hypothetical protein ELZ88_24865 (plasmid) [Salmonella enterica subsp. enterica serovar Karamoja]|uniref:Uncharacterized protein n=1 Tax=Salmonella enterica subsp. enterica serovar Karamoja TaxID=2500153 RepID=A0A3Q9MZL4_SALET|nr:hypothetical protein [Salmonella enterica]AZT39751.1 hypothetical protein ELZ88_24865 [Salmonella enterica subsp. enterica serovar Karamoja]AZT44346.1 hypothetical protein EL007_24100 [Salmonella enterica subsp. enterica serovar Karamoja]
MDLKSLKIILEYFFIHPYCKCITQPELPEESRKLIHDELQRLKQTKSVYKSPGNITPETFD